MPVNRTEDMHQIATYWAPGASDGLGGLILGAPVTVMCRWQATAKLFKDIHGEDVVSMAVAYVGEPLLPTGWLALGDLTTTADPTTLGNGAAFEIGQAGASPDLDNTEVLNKVWLV